MITLFIDTSTDILTVALFKDDNLLSFLNNDSKEHSKYAIMEIENLLNKCDVKPVDVNKIMVVNGPGSFTGVRIGVTIAKVFAWACNINVVPISTLKAYAISNTGYDYYVPMIDARREAVYSGIYDSNYNNVLEDTYIEKSKLKTEVDKLTNVLVIGDTNLENYNVLNNKIDVLKIYNYYKNDIGISPHKLNPVYLKKTEAEEKLGDYNA